MISYSPAVAISVYEDIVKPEPFIYELEKLIDETKGEDMFGWFSSPVGAGKTSQYRTSLSCPATPLLPPYPETPLAALFRNDIHGPLVNVVTDYIVNSGAGAGSREFLHILKYEGNAEYRAHHDHSPDTRRVFSLVASLGEAEEGGELEFPNFDVTIRLKAGSIVLFPSNFPYVHIAHPVKKGTKYSLVTWYS